MQARAWATARDADRGRRAAQAAVRSSIGAGIHDDDRQLSDWLDWLADADSAGNITPRELIAMIRGYSSRIVGVFREASSDAAAAAERLVQLAFPAEPALACAIAESLCEAGVVGEATAVQAVALAAARDSAVPLMLAATIAASMLLPIARVPSAAVAATVHARNGSADADELLDRAAAVWTVRDNPEDRGSAEGQALCSGCRTGARSLRSDRAAGDGRCAPFADARDRRRRNGGRVRWPVGCGS